MDKNETIHIESLKTLKKYTESYIPNKSYKKHKDSSSNVNKIHFHEKENSPKKHKKKQTSPNIKKTKKMHLNDNIISSSKHNHKHHHKKSDLQVDFFKENHFRNKSQDKPIKKNFVNQKFKIADDFNEENSNKFLNEKDEYLKEVILSDKIEKKKNLHFYEEDEKEELNDLSPIKKNEDSVSFNNNNFKRKKYIDDSIEFLSELIDDMK